MRTQGPPKYLLRFFKWFCKPEIHSFIEGDLLELYEEREQNFGRKKAVRLFALDVLKLFRLSIIRPVRISNNRNYLAMLRYNMLISLRNFKKDRTTFLINVIGLSTGLACAFLIFMWVQDELRMDRFHEHDDRLYQVMQTLDLTEGVRVVDWTPSLLAKTLKEDLPEISHSVATKAGQNRYDGILRYEDQYVKATPQYAGQEYFQIFSFPLLYGDEREVLKDKYATIISEKLALKLFSSSENAIGKTIEWNNKKGVDYGGVFTITGVFKDLPPNTSEHFDLIFPYDFFFSTQSNIGDWNNDPMATYVLVEEGVDINSLNDKITNVVASKRDYTNGFFLKKYSSKYLYANYDYAEGNSSGGRIIYVRLFSIIALMILLIACFNFMNLSTARSSTRMKEIGVKKTMGATRKNLILQFVSESLLISFIALLFAILWLTVFLPKFNQITGKELQFSLHLNLILSFLAIALITGLLSSSYPAIYLSAFKPVSVLKDKIKSSHGELWLRRGLVVFQFTTSIVLIISVIVIYQQMNYIQSKNLGFDRDNIMLLKNDGNLPEHLETFLSEAKQLPGVLYTSNSNTQLIGNENWTSGISWDGKPEDQDFVVNVITTKYDFIETFGIQLKSGRSFSRDFGTENQKLIINEAAATGMGINDPVGKIINFWGQDVEIIGLMENFQYQSLYNPVDPMVIRLFDGEINSGDCIWIKIQSGQEREAIEHIAGLYDKINPGFPFEYSFVDESFQSLYESEQRVAVLSRYFAVLAILISCLGLFGLALFLVEKRAKEISVRKVLGAKAIQIVGLLSRSYAKTIFISFSIALPISLWLASNWLGSFEYSIKLKWWYFGAALLTVVLLTWMSVGWQTLRAALADPIEDLRDE